jgi:thiol:disulfide interchange protein
MKKLLLSSVLAVLTLPASAVQIGDTLDHVLAEKGKPDNRLQAGATTILTYTGDTIKLKQGKVVEMKTAEQVAAAGVKVIVAPVAPGEWALDYPAALAQAGNENKNIFLFFTGSDWCGWCKKLDREILSTPEFKTYATENLILVKLDFPRRTPQSGQLKAQNTQLAEQYEVGGFPTIIVLNSSGEKIGRLGYMEGGPKGFLKELKSF